jgi:cellulase
MLSMLYLLSGHSAVINYMARCDGPCSSFKGDTGSPWFKISQDVYNSTTQQWASDVLAWNNHSWSIPIPRNIVPGEYLLRHEILALHAATSTGPQFYPVCVQLNVTGSGTFKPQGNVSFPGTYTMADPGIAFNPWYGDEVNRGYVAPGGGVLSGLKF